MACRGGRDRWAAGVGDRAAVGGRDPPGRQDDKPNTYEEITTYNNYYEFGTDKEDPEANANNFGPSLGRCKSTVS